MSTPSIDIQVNFQDWGTLSCDFDQSFVLSQVVIGWGVLLDYMNRVDAYYDWTNKVEN